LTAIVVDPAVSAWTAADLSGALDRANVETRPVWKPMHLQPVSEALRGLLDGTSERIFDRGLTLPAGSVLSDGDFDRIERAILEVTAA
jgi:dTDP-4-amino-4,6-dideoxygalactose transaminase